MAKVKHAVVDTSLMSGTDVRTDLLSVRFYDNDALADIDNGNIVDVANGLDEGENQIYKAVAPTADSKINTLVVLAAPEVMADERLRNNEDYYNEAGKAIRAYRLTSGSVFSATAEAFEGTPEKGQKVGVKASSTKLKVGASTGVVGVIDNVIVLDSRTLYSVKID